MIGEPSPPHDHDAGVATGVAVDLRTSMVDAPEPGPLRGRLAVVTGGSGRIGRAIALALARSGARVCVIGRDLGRLRATTDEAGRDAPMLYLQCDLGSAREVEGLGEFIERFDRPVDLLVHAAGVTVPGTVMDGEPADFDEQYLVNVRGPLLVTQTFLPQLRAGRGEVVFVRPAVDPTTSTTVRVTTRGAEALAEGLAVEESANGIRVSSVVVAVADPPVDEDVVASAVVDLVRLGSEPAVMGGFTLRIDAPLSAPAPSGATSAIS